MYENLAFENDLAKMGYIGKFTSIKHLKDLKFEIDSLRDAGNLNDWIYNNYLQFDFDLKENYKSILIVAMKLPLVQIEVTKNETLKNIMIPSAYYSGGKVQEYNNNINTLFSEKNVKYKPVHLPCKLLLTRTGLGKYGKNNIAYTKEFGSYFRLRAFLTDVEILSDNWHEPKQTEMCSDCSICVDNCPSKIIDSTMYPIDAGKCLSFFNEIEGEFPDWINSKWHNSLIGCMRCQIDCPNNSKFLDEIDTISTFSQENIDDIFYNSNFESLNEDTKYKITIIEFSEHYNVFRRNLLSVYANI